MNTTTSAAPAMTGNLIGGRIQSPPTKNFISVTSPIDGRVLGKVPVSGEAEVNTAVLAAEAAFGQWSQTPVKERAEVFFRFKTLLEQNLDSIAESVSRENGKTHAEARAEVEKGIEVTAFATSLPQVLQQETLEVSRGVDCTQKRYPLGVVAGVTPFNFPAMVPLWMIPIAIAAGNSFILKPSEQVPLTANLLGEILGQAGLPAGVFNIVHGAREAVEAISAHPRIKAIGFVGSSRVAKIVYEKGTLSGKRVLALGGAKNHLVVMPDADPDITAANVAASAYGCAGQRCMAASVLILVGDGGSILSRIKAEAEKFQAGKTMGPVISAAAKERIEAYIDRAEAAGAKLLLDGRHTVVPGKEAGTYVNPSLIDGLPPDHACACDEIFGPVLTVLRVDTLDEALAIENNNPYGNAASIYTRNGGTARYFSDHAAAGMIGVNIGVPVPREPFSFGGWNQSRYGYGDITGMDGLRFWTNLKKITTKWNAAAANNWMS